MKEKFDRISETFVLGAVFFLPFSKTLGEYGFLLAIFFWLLGKITARERLFPMNPVTLSYLFFIFAVILSIFHVREAWINDSIRGILKWIKFIGIFFMCQDLFRSPEKSKKLFMAFLASMSLVTLNGFYQMWGGEDFVKRYSVDIPGRLVRMRSSFGSPNDLATFYLFALPISFQYWFEEKKWRRKSVCFAVLLALFFTGFMLTLSRAAFFSLAIALLFFFRRKRVGATRASPLLILAAIVLFLASSGTLRENFVGSLHLKDKTICERLRFWNTTWEMIKERPLLGSGVNTYYKEFAAHAPPEEKYRGYAHNCYLQMWSEIGIFGLVFFLYPFIRTFSVGVTRASPLHTALTVGILAYLIQSAFDTNFYAMQTAHLFWVFWGTCVGFKKRQKNGYHKS